MYEGKENLLEQTYALAVENNKLLKKMRAGARWGFLFKLLFWAVMLGVPVWLYFTILQPVVAQGLGVLDQVQSAAGQVQGLTGKAGLQSGQLQDLLNSIKSSVPGLGTTGAQ